MGYSPQGRKELDSAEVTELKHMYVYNWFTSLCSRNQHNIVKQLFFPRKLIKKATKQTRIKAKYIKSENENS